MLLVIVLNFLPVHCSVPQAFAMLCTAGYSFNFPTTCCTLLVILLTLLPDPLCSTTSVCHAVHFWLFFQLSYQFHCLVLPALAMLYTSGYCFIFPTSSTVQYHQRLPFCVLVIIFNFPTSTTSVCHAVFFSLLTFLPVPPVSAMLCFSHY